MTDTIRVSKLNTDSKYAEALRDADAKLTAYAVATEGMQKLSAIADNIPEDARALFFAMLHNQTDARTKREAVASVIRFYVGTLSAVADYLEKYDREKLAENADALELRAAMQYAESLRNQYPGAFPVLKN